METKDNKELRVYVQPETIVVEFTTESILGGIESGGEDEL